MSALRCTQRAVIIVQLKERDKHEQQTCQVFNAWQVKDVSFSGETQFEEVRVAASLDSGEDPAF
jgi:hypothetical protein